MRAGRCADGQKSWKMRTDGSDTDSQSGLGDKGKAVLLGIGGGYCPEFGKPGYELGVSPVCRLDKYHPDPRVKWRT